MLAGLDPRMTDEERDAGSGGGGRTGVGLATKPLAKTAKPALYKVLMLNDDYTPMEFVVLTLQRFFKMIIEDATRVMLHVHQRGVGVCGKDGQSVPVGVGQPTLRIDGMTVGGTA